MRAEQAVALEARAEAAAPSVSGTEFAVTGMTCANCARHVTEAIQSVPGVSSATVRLEANRASVRWAAGAEQDMAAVIHAVEEAGYGASVVEAQAHEHERVQAERVAAQLVGWRARHGAADAGRMGVRARHDAVVPVVFLGAGGRRAGSRRRTVLSRRLGPAQGGPLEHGHARGARLDDCFRLQHVGLVQHSRQPRLFHGGRRDYHADQLAGIGWSRA